MSMVIKQKCPYCNETLTYDVTSTQADREQNERGESIISLRAQTTPESTAHVWSHAPEAAK